VPAANPAFALADPDPTRLLAALVALGTIREETPYRVFSVRTFNDSKAFEPLKVRLRPWRGGTVLAGAR
jgi:hypothetical protein